MYRENVFLLLVAVLAASTLLVSAASCTPQDCAGPVLKSFSSSDCSGTPNIGTASDQAEGVCAPISTVYTKYTCDAQKGVMVGYFGDSACSADQAILYNNYAVGVCVSSAGSSYAYVCSVNDTIAPVQAPSTSYPIIDSSTVECNSPGYNGPANAHPNCTSLNPVYYTTLYSVNSTAPTCPNADQASSYAAPASANFSLNSCFYNPDSNTTKQVSCTQDYYISSSYQNPLGCVGTPISSIIMSRKCGIAAGGKKRDLAHISDLLDFYTTTTITCDAPPTPTTPIPPSSTSAPSPSASKALIFLVSVLAAFTVLF